MVIRLSLSEESVRGVHEALGADVALPLTVFDSIRNQRPVQGVDEGTAQESERGKEDVT